MPSGHVTSLTGRKPAIGPVRAVGPVMDNGLRAGRAVLVGTTFFAAVTCQPGPAHAFELFGYKVSTDGITKIEPATAAQDIVNPVRYSVALKSDDDSLTESLQSASSLFAKRDTPVSGTSGLLVLARADHKRLIASLYQQGHYGGTVDITIEGQRYDRLAPDTRLSGNAFSGTSLGDAGQADKKRVIVEIDVTTGKTFTFAPPVAQLRDGTPIDLEHYGVTTGAPAYSQAVLDAEEAILADYRQAGYALARIQTRALEADHDTGQLEVNLTIDRGPKARFGGVEISGSDSVDADFIAKQADIPTGETYSPDAIAKAKKTLDALGVFDSVIVRPADAVTADGSLPVRIDVTERKPRTLGAGVTVGNLDGLGIEGYWVHRNLFGKAERLRVEGAVSNIGKGGLDALDYNAAILFSKPGLFGPTSAFDAKLSAVVTNPEAFEKRSVSGEMGISNAWSDALSSRAGLKVEFAKIKDSSGTDRHLLFSAPLELTYDKRDSKLDPTQGFSLLLAAEPTINSDGSVAFLKSSATLTAYHALDDAKRFVLAGKLSGGTIIGADKADIPADRRYYAGGGGTIRGYAYQLAGPRDANNDPTGGRSYLVGSVEARAKVTDSLGLAAFVDTGGAFDDLMPGKSGDWYTGVGAGVRYLTPIGPLRLDVAVPLKKIDGEPKYGVYLGLGQAF